DPNIPAERVRTLVHRLIDRYPSEILHFSPGIELVWAPVSAQVVVPEDALAHVEPTDKKFIESLVPGEVLDYLTEIRRRGLAPFLAQLGLVRAPCADDWSSQFPRHIEFLRACNCVDVGFIQESTLKSLVQAVQSALVSRSAEDLSAALTKAWGYMVN